MFRSCGNICVSYVQRFFEETTFHGFRHIVAPKRHLLEIFLWALIVAGATIGACLIIYRNYDRYNANPVVITLDRNYRAWNVTFPATTFCFVDRLDKEKAEAIIKRKWNLTKGPKFEYYMRFLTALANSSYYTLGAFREFAEDELLNKEDLAVLMNEVNYDIEDNFAPSLFNEQVVHYKKTFLEMGICYSMNSLVTQMLVREMNQTMLKMFQPIYCHYLTWACYGVTEHLQRDLVYFVHSPFETPDASSKPKSLECDSQRRTNYKHLDILASPNLRNLKPLQRRCLFYDETQYKNTPLYSNNLCQIECRKKLAMKYCKCIPHIYTHQGGKPHCNIKQLKCLAEKHVELLRLSEKKGSEESCPRCYPTCDEVAYVETDEEITPFAIAAIPLTQFHWAIMEYNKSRFKRDVIFTFEDLLVTLGGTASFFLGSSIMSAVELIYFFTLRLIRYIGKKTSKNLTSVPTRDFLQAQHTQGTPRRISDAWGMARQSSFEIIRPRLFKPGRY